MKCSLCGAPLECRSDGDWRSMKCILVGWVLGLLTASVYFLR